MIGLVFAIKIQDADTSSALMIWEGGIRNGKQACQATQGDGISILLVASGGSLV